MLQSIGLFKKKKLKEEEEEDQYEHNIVVPKLTSNFCVNSII